MMDSQQRGRSASVGHRSIHQLNQSPSPHPFPDNSTGLDLDLSGSSTFPTGTFNADVGTSNSLDDMQYAYLNSSTQGPRYDQSPLPNHGLPDLKQSFLPNGISTDLSDRPSSLDMEQSNQQFPSDMLGITNPSRFGDFSQDQDSTKEQAQRYDNTFSIDPELQEIPSQQQSVNPADIMSDMSSPPNMMPTPPSLMPPESRSSRQGSPVPQQSQLYSPSHSRHTSLDPSSAMFASGQQQTDWAGMLRQSQFQTHRRAPSEHSDVSSSVTPSPFLQQEGFDIDPNRSPMMHAQPDNPLYQEAFGIEHFSLSEPPPQHPGTSPAHSPFISPRVPPYSALGIPHESNQLLLSPNVHNGFAGGPGPEIYAGQTDAFPPFNPNLAVNEMGQAAQMAPPPDITVDLAPTTRQPNFEPSRPENDTDALSPPDRGRKGRIRAKSETFISRPVSPNSHSPHLSALDINSRRRSLSPFDTSLSPNGSSRDASPASSKASSRRQSTGSTVPNRDYILELADPNRPAASGLEKRVQKHPATFQCTLCPKRFTRAYNLRSHLRTHTDERPFVCTVCGKAFARQHDRKRHEGLHSGEKKFVCKGELGMGESWGCGRRFARADALGRHFRSEAGRICIKPLLDEEAMERQRILDEQILSHAHPSSIPPGMQPSGPQLAPHHAGINGVSPNNNNAGFTLPAALLVQYPALQALQWDQLGQGPSNGADADDGGVVSGRSSFDASSQGDYYDDEPESGGNSGYASASPGGTGGGSEIGWATTAADARGDWASDLEGR